MGMQLSDLENIVGKQEIARYEQFLLFPLMFSKCCLLLMRQNEYLYSKGLKKKKTAESELTCSWTFFMNSISSSRV